VQAAPRAAAAVEAVSGAANGRLAAKLGELGLTAQQAEAVLALSREVVERVVWEVVPALAETMIKEEIARITKEG
jgi:endonuclease III